jgi:hypothetical protein
MWARVVSSAVIATGRALGSACGGSSDSTAPSDEVQSEVQYSMQSSETNLDVDLPPNLLLVMRMENPSAAAIERVYPAGCPIRFRIYRSLDNTLLYDETKLACTLTTPVTMRIQPGEARTIGSGFRQMPGIMGDSIPCGTYRLVGVPGTEGTKVVEVEAGETVLRAYPDWPAANPNALFQC